MPHPLRDWWVSLVDAAGNAINAGNPLDTTGSGSVTLQSATVIGQVYVGGTLVDIKRVHVNYSVLAATTIVAAVPAKKIRVVAWSLWCSLNTSLEWRSNTTVVIQPIDLPSRQQQGDSFYPGFWIETTAGEALMFRQDTGTPAVIRGTLEYVEV